MSTFKSETLMSSTILRSNNKAVAQRLGDEIVLVHPTTDRIFLLNRTGARVWELLSEGSGLDLGEVSERLLKEFDGEREDVERDIAIIIEELSAEGFVSRADR